MIRRVAPLLALALMTTPAWGDGPTVHLGGYLQPQLEATYRKDAVARDRWSYGVGTSRAALIVSGDIGPYFAFVLHTVLGAETIDVVTGAVGEDQNGDGTIDVVTVSTETTATVDVEEATVAIRPIPDFQLLVGRMRVPFTVQASSANTELLFLNRSEPSAVFVSEPDLGVLAVAGGDQMRLCAGLWNGTGREAGLGLDKGRGLLFSGRADLATRPFPFDEGDFERGPLRAGVGGGATYRRSVTFDDAGAKLAEQTDLKLTASLRLAGAGFYLQGEILYRRLEDSLGLSGRPRTSLGGYLQTSYFVKPGSWGFAPLGRAGWVTEDREVMPQRTIFLEAGFAVHPLADDPQPDRVRFVVQYFGELRETEAETAHGARAQAQVTF